MNIVDILNNKGPEMRTLHARPEGVPNGEVPLFICGSKAWHSI